MRSLRKLDEVWLCRTWRACRPPAISAPNRDTQAGRRSLFYSRIRSRSARLPLGDGSLIDPVAPPGRPASKRTAGDPPRRDIDLPKPASREDADLPNLGDEGAEMGISRPQSC
jgi:hypothetical protein